MVRASVTLHEEHEDYIEQLQAETHLSSRSEVVRTCIEAHRDSDPADSERLEECEDELAACERALAECERERDQFAAEIEELEADVERLRNEKRLILEQRSDAQTLARAVEEHGLVPVDDSDDPDDSSSGPLATIRGWFSR